MQGFASGALGSLAGSGFQELGGNFAKSAAGTIGFSAVAGGVGAALTAAGLKAASVAGGALAGAVGAGIASPMAHSLHHINNYWRKFATCAKLTFVTKTIA